MLAARRWVWIADRDHGRSHVGRNGCNGVRIHVAAWAALDGADIDIGLSGSCIERRFGYYHVVESHEVNAISSGHDRARLNGHAGHGVLALEADAARRLGVVGLDPGRVERAADMDREADDLRRDDARRLV